MNHLPEREQKVVVISFLGYFTVPSARFVIKEFGLLSLQLDNKFMGYQLGITGVFGPPCDWKELTVVHKNFYNQLKEKHGIPWKLNTFDVNRQKEILENYINGTFIYVASPMAKKNLLQIIGNSYAEFITCLTDFGFRQNEILGTDCPYHENPENNICAYDYAKKMYQWIIERNIFQNLDMLLPHERSYKLPLPRNQKRK
ncbi:putative Bracovirus particle protein MdBV-1-13 [Microplitis demolitor]